jgi:hypothetical protein
MRAFRHGHLATTVCAAVACSIVLAACGGDARDLVLTGAGGNVVTVPSPDTTAVAAMVRTDRERAAERSHLTHPTRVGCRVVAHIEQRPRGRQFDYRCDVSYPDSESQECVTGGLDDPPDCAARSIPPQSRT